MATLTPDTLKRLLDSGLSMNEVRSIASARGDSVPGPTLAGSLLQPIIQGGVWAGQKVGSGIAQLLGAPQENINKAMQKSMIFKAPGFGTIPIEPRQPLSTTRGKEQVGGLALETAGTFFPIGRGATLLRPFLGKTLGTATALGLSGYGIETGSKLTEGAPNPYTPGLGTAIPAAIPIVGPALGLTARSLRTAFAKTSGLDTATIETILTKPSEFQAAKSSGLDRLTLGNLIEDRVSSLEKTLHETGPGYDTVRGLQKKITLTESPINKVLSDLHIGLENGKLILTPESPPLSTGDVNALERFIGQYGQEKTLTPNALLNARGGLDILSNWQRDPSMTKFSEDIARALRTQYDNVAKVQLPELKKLDEKYAPVVTELKQLRKDFLQYRDGQWVLKDNALTKIANATKTGKEQLLGRLEKYVPGISQQIQMVRALEDITASSGQKVGSYLQSIVLGGGAFALGVNPVLSLLAAVVTLPQLSIPMLIAFGKANGISQSIIRNIAGKLLAGKTLTNEELILIKKSILDHLNKVSPGDQFFDSSLGQRSAAYIKQVRPGLSIRDVNKDPFPGDSFQGFQDLSTKLLEKLKGRTTVSRQFIEDLTNSPDLKQAERDLIRRVLAENFDNAGSKVKVDAPTLTTLKDKYSNLELGIYENPQEINLSKVVVPSTERGKGIGSSFMQDLTDYADIQGKRIVLTPSKDFGGSSVSRLTDFYKRFGFVENKGAKRDFSTRESMIRPAQSTQGKTTGLPRQEGALGANQSSHNDTISVPDFANKVKSELLPLKGKTSIPGLAEYEATGKQMVARYENITLPDELRGPIANYSERVYESPIKTSAGNVHSFNTDKYFAHTRIEDLPNNASQEQTRLFKGTSEYNPSDSIHKIPGNTRRVIEIQSDLFQKGRFGSEFGTNSGNFEDRFYEAFKNLQKEGKINTEYSKLSSSERKVVADEANKIISKNEGKLEPYRNTWHERVIREEVKQAAKDGKTKLQFPTGETAMKIEGLGERNTFQIGGGTRELRPTDLKIGFQVRTNGDEWIITDVLGDGKFKAVPKTQVFEKSKNTKYLQGDEKYLDSEHFYPETSVETFDISGKVDTNNPIYKFYEKEVGKYLKNKYGAELVTDPQGVKWWEVKVKPEMGKAPIEAFGAGLVGLTGAELLNRQDEVPKSIPIQRGEDFFRIRNKDLDELSAILYGEISNRTPDKQQLEARTIIGTVLNRMKESGDTMLEVLQQPNQYQAFGGKQYTQYKNGEVNQAKAKVIQDIISELRKGDLSNPQYNAFNAFYYKHKPDGSIVVDDKKPLYAN